MTRHFSADLAGSAPGGAGTGNQHRGGNMMMHMMTNMMTDIMTDMMTFMTICLRASRARGKPMAARELRSPGRGAGREKVMNCQDFGIVHVRGKLQVERPAGHDFGSVQTGLRLFPFGSI
jgi:hypothetical protein